MMNDLLANGLKGKELLLSDRCLLESVFLNANRNDFGDSNSVEWRHAEGFLKLGPLLSSSVFGISSLTGFMQSAGIIFTKSSDIGKIK